MTITVISICLNKMIFCFTQGGARVDIEEREKNGREVTGKVKEDGLLQLQTTR